MSKLPVSTSCHSINPRQRTTLGRIARFSVSRTESGGCTHHSCKDHSHPMVKHPLVELRHQEVPASSVVSCKPVRPEPTAHQAVMLRVECSNGPWHVAHHCYVDGSVHDTHTNSASDDCTRNILLWRLRQQTQCECCKGAWRERKKPALDTPFP